MIEIKTQSHLLHFMLGTLRLSRQDAKFLHNLSTLIHNKQNITSNQVGLYKRILNKYERQLAKHGFYLNLLLELPYNVPIIQSSYEYTNAFIRIVDDTITLKCPYSQKFISTLRNQNGNEAFVWNKSLRQYEGKFNTFNLKLIVDTTFVHFENASCCPITINLLDQLLPVEEAKYWNPTLEYINGNYLILAANEHLLSAIEHIELNDKPNTLSTLSYYGIIIGDNIKQKSKLHKFAGEFDTEVEVTDTDFIVDSIKSIGSDIVFISSGDLNSNKSKNEIINGLKSNNIKVHNVNLFNNWGDTSVMYSQNYKFPVYIRFKKSHLVEVNPIKKIVTLVNSTPINIK